MIAVVDTTQEEGLAELYRANYVPLVRLAALLLGDVAAAEDVVQESFVRMHRSWDRVTDPSKRAAYLRSIVMNGARTGVRRRATGRRLELVHRVGTADDTEHAALRSSDRDEVVRALRGLPVRQRECLVLRYYLDLPEAAIAETLRISKGAVKTHTHRGLAALERALEKTR